MKDPCRLSARHYGNGINCHRSLAVLIALLTLTTVTTVFCHLPLVNPTRHDVNIYPVAVRVDTAAFHHSASPISTSCHSCNTTNAMADPKDAAKHQKIPSESSTRTQKQRRQQKYRRSNTLVQKAYELSTMADVDVFLGIRDRKTGRIKTFCADDKTGFWSSRMEHLVCFYCLSERLQITS